MVNQKEYLHILLKNAIEAIDVADIQRARDLIQAAQAQVKEREDLYDFECNWKMVRPNDALLKEFGW